MIRGSVMWYISKIVVKECEKYKTCKTCPFGPRTTRCAANQVLDGIREERNEKRHN